MTNSRSRLHLFLLSFAFVTLISGCGDRLSSTYPKMKAFVSDAGFVQQSQVPSPANLGPAAPWYGIATKSGTEYVVVIYPATQKIYAIPLGVKGRLTHLQMVQRLMVHGYVQVDKRLRLNGITVNDEHKISLCWIYRDDKGVPSKYFDLQGNQIDTKVPQLETIFSFQG